MIVVTGGVTAAKGFLASGLSAGIKKSGRKDLALLYSEVPAVAAGAFTTNVFQASPLKISKVHLSHKMHQALIVNSGNANCANGKAGERAAVATADYIARALCLDRREVLVASTGIIGRPLPVEKIKCKVADLVAGLSKEGARAFSEAILTTDTVKKECALKVRIGSSTVTIGGAAKGVGMIYPEMKVEKHATTLCFITTDASISKAMLASSLGEAIEESFNMASVDGDMSTNDSCFIIANGMAGNKRIADKGQDYSKFTAALKSLTTELAKKLVKDGEGATKFVTIEVAGAKSRADAARIARKTSTSSLFKACLYGEDPNWGRVVAAAGSAGVDFNPDKADLYLGGVKVLSNGASVKFDTAKAMGLFKKKDIYIKLDLKCGHAKATAWTCDLSEEYVRINAEYST